MRQTCRFLRLLLSACYFVLALAPAYARDERPSFRFPEGRHGNGSELKYVNGLPVLLVSGSPEDIGAGVGSLALKPAPKSLGYPRDLLRHRHVEFLYDVFVSRGNLMFRQFPADYQKELEAMAQSAAVARDPVVVGNTLFDLKKFLFCSALMVEAGKSGTGGPLLGRNLDYPPLGYIHEYSLITVYRPRGKHAFAAVGFPGLVGCLSGMNDAGLAVAVLEVFDLKDGPHFNAKGIPYALCYRKVLEECTTIAEAKKLLEGLPRTSTTSLAVADRSGVGVLEITPERVEMRSAEREACVCTNHFCTISLKPAKPLNVLGSFERYAALAKVREEPEKLTVEGIRQHLDEVNLGRETLQTMVFEPATLRLHLGIGKVPASELPLRPLDLQPLFKGEWGRVEKKEAPRP